MSSAKVYHGGGGKGKGAFSGVSPNSEDHKVLRSASDTTAAFLDGKISAGSGIVLSTLNPGANEQLSIAASTQLGDRKVLRSASDTTAAFLDGKISAGSGIVLSTLNPGANEQLSIAASTQLGDHKILRSASDTTPNYLSSKLVAGSNITLTTLNSGANEQISIASSDVDKNNSTLTFGTGLSLAVGIFVPPSTDGSSWANGNIGHYVPSDSKIVKCAIMLPRFVSYNNSESITFQFRRIAASTARGVSALSASSGVSLGTLNILCPNTSGTFWFNNYGGSSPTWILNAGDLVFCVISAMTANAVTGAVIYLSVLDT